MTHYRAGRRQSHGPLLSLPALVVAKKSGASLCQSKFSCGTSGVVRRVQERVCQVGWHRFKGVKNGVKNNGQGNGQTSGIGPVGERERYDIGWCQ